MNWAEYFKKNSDKMPKEFLDKEITIEDCLNIISGMSFMINELFGKTKWHTEEPTEKGDYLCAFEMSDESLEYGWCQWDGNAWDILCDYDSLINEMVAWRKFEPYKESKE